MNQRPSKEELSGMTMNERLFACGLVDDFQAALRQDDRGAFIAVLMQIGFAQEVAESYAKQHFLHLAGKESRIIK